MKNFILFSYLFLKFGSVVEKLVGKLIERTHLIASKSNVLCHFMWNIECRVLELLARLGDLNGENSFVLC